MKKLLALILALTSAPVTAAVVAASPATLPALLAKAAAGDVLSLAGGIYGGVTISKKYDRTLTIQSAHPDRPAIFTSIQILNARGVTLHNLQVGGVTGSSPATRVAIGTSEQVHLSGLTVAGNADGDPTNDAAGVTIRASKSVSISDSHFQELRRGIAVSFSADVQLERNVIQNMGEDGLDFAEVQQLKVVGNQIGGFSKIAPGMHPDGIQFMTAGTKKASADIEIRDNVILQGDGQVMQGIFLGNELGIPFRNVSIINNLIYTQQYHGIAIGAAENVTVANNTVLSQAGDKVASWIRLNNVTGAMVRDNVAEQYVFVGSSKVVDEDNVDLTKQPELAKLLPGIALGAKATVDSLTLKAQGFRPLSASQLKK